MATGCDLHTAEENTAIQDEFPYMYKSGIGLRRSDLPLPVKQPGFLRRQFSAQVTKRQRLFDMIFGVALPVLCFYFDPVVFKSDSWLRAGGDPILGGYQVFAYSTAAVAMAAMLAQIHSGARMKPGRGILGAIQLLAAIFAIGIGLAMLPMTIMGLIFLIGFLGLIPFITAFVYFRSAYRSFELAQQAKSIGHPLHLMVLAATVLFGLPVLVSWQVSLATTHAADAIAYGDEAHAAVAEKRMAHYMWARSQVVSKLNDRVAHAEDTARRERIERACVVLTGSSQGYCE